MALWGLFGKKGSKDLKENKELVESKENIDLDGSKETKNLEEVQENIDLDGSKETKNPEEVQENIDLDGSKETKNLEEVQENIDLDGSKETKNPEEVQENIDLDGSKETKEHLDKGLKKTKESVFKKLTRIVAGKSKVDDDVLDDLEEVLITSDVGVDTTLRIIKRIEERVHKNKYLGTSELNSVLKEEIVALLEENDTNDIDKLQEVERKDPYVIMVVGVNGVGKTTTIGKLANKFKKAGKSVVLGAADTFRAAAVEQLVIWAERVGVPIVKQGMGSDPASVAFDTLSRAKAMNADVVLIDTAGRLHNKINLMNELTKIKNVMKKVLPNAPDEVLLVLDGSTGQNAYEQAKQFTLATEVTSLAITKLDGTAKGGVVIGISDQFKIPVKYIGIGEQIDDLQIFDRVEFVNSLFK